MTGTNPKNGTVLPPDHLFTLTWTVMNTGNRDWDVNSVDYLYDSGKPMHLQALYNISNTVVPGGSINLPVSMRTPPNPGSYVTVWKMRKGQQGEFCSMKFTVTVK